MTGFSPVANGSGLFTASSVGESELTEVLAASGGARVERIVSPPAYASPNGFWFDQEWPEWVAVIAGSAGLVFEGEAEAHSLSAGEHILIPAGCRHRIAWTDPGMPTIWLVVHLPAEA